MNRRLFRSPDDRILAGVAGGMAESWDLDPALVRIGWALLILLTGGVFLVPYIVMALVVPLRPAPQGLWAASTPDAEPPHLVTVPPGGPTQGGPTPPPWSYGARNHRDNATGPILIGLLLVGVGGFLLLRQYVPTLNFALIWPAVAIAIGLLLIVAAAIRREPQR